MSINCLLYLHWIWHGLITNYGSATINSATVYCPYWRAVLDARGPMWSIIR